MMMLEPRRDVDQQRKARCMRLGEAVLAEAADLLEDLLGELRAVAALQHASDQALVHVLQAAAARFGHEAALFCPSGTMTHQIAIHVHTRPGDEIVVSGVGRDGEPTTRQLSNKHGDCVQQPNPSARSGHQTFHEVVQKTGW